MQLDQLFHRVFKMPPMDIEFPFEGRFTALYKAIASGYEFAFKAGVWQGFLAGMITALIVMKGLELGRRTVELQR